MLIFPAHDGGLPMNTTTHGPGYAVATALRPVLLRLDLLVRRQHSLYLLSRAQTSILNTLVLHGELRMSELARLENVRVPTTSNAVSVIEDLGLVERLRDATDKRGVHVRLTDLGRTRIGQVLAARDRDMADRIDSLSAEHREALAAAAPALTALLDSFDELDAAF
ncbi:MAG TPA: MarR family transcriptional regulator [Candidatus Dietzia intestinipullorum]|nr:MarR family transcriptional regulator [Candidatus Dietzia intestinipullorum]